MIRSRHLLIPVAAGISGVLSVVTIVLARANGSDAAAFVAENQANTWLAGAASAAVAILIWRSQPGHRLAGVFAAAGLLAASSAAAFEYSSRAFAGSPDQLPVADLAAWVAGLLWLPAFLLVLVAVPLLFPTGGLPSPRWRWPARVALAGGALATVLVGMTETIVDDVDPAAVNPFSSGVPDAVLVPAGLACFAVTIAIGVAAVGATVLRMRHLGEPERQQHAWFVAAVAILLAVTWAPVPDVVSFAANGLAVAALGVGIVRYQLFDIEVVLSRTLVYTLLTAAAMAVYLAVAALVGAQLGGGAGPALAAAVAALGLAGLRGRLQQAVDRALYGQRKDPIAALVGLGEQLEGAVSADQVLPVVTKTVRSTLRLPYAAVELAGETAPAHASGTLPDRTARFPLVHAGEPVGALVVGLRRGESGMPPADTRVLAAFSPQLAVAVHDARVTRELRRSRERIVLAREEERRRLRRDLHDGLGPALAGISLGLETAGRAAARNDTQLAALLSRIHDEAAGAASDVRQIVADLRPPALDAVGLAASLSHHADLLTSRSAGRLDVDVTAGELDSLPAAVEVAAYRIALEALTNTVRHAGARSCSVSIAMDGDLRLTVRDDGCGLPGAGAGMGLTSMRDRAEELGGTCTVTFVEGVGTTVEAVLPVERP